MKHDFFIDWSPDFRDRAALLEQLASANLANGGPSGHRNIAIILRDRDTGAAISGVWGNILYGWLFIELIYVAQPDRGRGLGSRLLAAVEKAAHENGCVGSWLSTFAFQAPGFYEKNGYEQFAVLSNAFASGGAADTRTLFYRKSFGRSASDSPGSN